MPAAFFTTVRNPEPFRRGLIPITLISRPLSLATVQEVLETGGDDDEEQRGRKEGALSEMHLQGVVSRRDSRWMRGLAEEGRGLAEKGTAGERTGRGGHCRCVSGSEGSVHYAGMEQTSAKTLAWY